MCTPVGHSLAGGAVLAAMPGRFRSKWIALLVVLTAANLPDIDLLFGAVKGNPNLYHHLWTHSIVFCLLAGVVLMMMVKQFSALSRIRVAGILILILGSHLVLDFFTRDTSLPYGQQLFWPFSQQFVSSALTPLPDVYKSSENQTFLRTLFSLHNLKTVAVEAAVFTPVLAAAFKLKKRYG